MKSATACKSSMRRERCAINGPLATRTRAMTSCRVSGMCARNLAPLHRRRGPHAIPSHAGARHLVSMRGSCLGCMDGMGRVGFPHLHDTLTPGQPHARTCASPDLGVGEEGSRFSIGRGLDLRVIEGWSMSTRAGQIIHGGWRARGLTLADFCALEHDEKCCAAGQHPWRSATCSCLLRVHAQEGLPIWRRVKFAGLRRGMAGSNPLCPRGEEKKPFLT